MSWPRTTVKKEHRQPKPKPPLCPPRVFRKKKVDQGPAMIGPIRREEARVELAAQLKEARGQQIYWTERRLMADLRHERAICGARALAWGMTVKALLEKLNRKVAA